MNLDIDLFQRVAAREIEPEAAVSMVIQRHRIARERQRPKWMPKFAFAICTLIVLMVLDVFGIRSKNI